MFGTRSKKYTQYDVETNQILQLVYRYQGQFIYVQLLSDNSFELMKES